MAASNGLASSKVSVERAMKACTKARLLLLYWLSASSAILRLARSVTPMRERGIQYSNVADNN